MIEFVLDCSVAISWCLVDEDNDYANAVLDLMPNAEAFVREIWSLEMAIALCIYRLGWCVTLSKGAPYN